MRLTLLIIPIILQTCVHEELRVGFEYVKLVEIEFTNIYRGKKFGNFCFYHCGDINTNEKI